MAGSGSLRRFANKVGRSIRKGSTSTPSAPPAGPGGVTVSYAPDDDGDADPGEVVWTWVPYEDDPSQGKDRPVLVIGWAGPLLACIQLSSKDHSGRPDAREWIEVGRGAWDSQHRVSYADASRLLRLDPSGVRREGSAVDRSRFEAVVARVRELHGEISPSRATT